MKLRNKPFTKTTLLVLLFLGSLSVGNTQEHAYKKNALYASYGTVIFSSQISLAYDRTVYEKNKFRTKVKLNYGNYADKYPDLESGERKYRSYYGLSGVVVFGIFEVSLGAASAKFTLARGFMPSPDVDYDDVKNGIVFQGSTGIRYENNGIVLRTGIGNLDLLYFGIGLIF